MTFNIHEAKTQLSRLIQRAEAGEEVVIARDGKPVVKMVAVEPERPKSRVPGSAKGQIWISDDFNDPLPPEIQQYFE